MSMTQTMSHPNDWAQFYRQINFSGQPSQPVEIPAPHPPSVPDHHVGTLDTSSSLSAAVGASGSSPVHGSSSSAGALNAGGRVAKPKRRRSRASRRTPTTLLSTDTTNFRAMVQQFTGGPGAHFLATVGTTRPGALNINFGLEPGRAHINPPGLFHGQHPLQHHGADHRPAFSHVMQDQAYMNMLSLDHRGATSPEFPPRPPFMQ
ncbi:VQ motif-containing protein 22-like [Punica granatum]|uniref:Uncharacterized protein n=2 Tax=Punica granatum TaxID=22663 RepID=A0A2I0IBI6_PUNGR|nr:VQ motif-containing protein 22-like [Punica granatum]PKI41020.1 hypothetical protein CRG98_038548 [Punica granatum]